MEILYRGLGDILNYIYYNFWPNYGVAIIILTILVKIVLLPIAIKQQKAMVGIQKIQPHIEEIRNKYKNDLNKMNEETMKLYSEHKVNPLGGCLPALIQLPIFIALYKVITEPLTYILNLSQAQIDALRAAYNLMGGSEIQLAEISQKLSMHFLGLNLALTPNIYTFNAVLLVPVLAAVTTYLSSKISMAMTPSAVENPMQKSMLTMLPLITLFVTFSFPTGLGLYWIVSNIIQMIQQYFLNKYVRGEVAAAK